MKSIRPIRENCFGWWLADIEDEIQSCSHTRVRPLGHSVCLVCQSNHKADHLRNQQLTYPTGTSESVPVPPRKELFQLIQSERLKHLERHQSIIETVLGSKPITEDETEEKSSSPSTRSTPPPTEFDFDKDDVEMMNVIEEAVRNGYVDKELAQQVSRLRELASNLTQLRSTSRVLQQGLQDLDTTASRLLSSARVLRRDAQDLCFLERMLAAADGFLSLSTSSNLII